MGKPLARLFEKVNYTVQNRLKLSIREMDYFGCFFFTVLYSRCIQLRNCELIYLRVYGTYIRASDHKLFCRQVGRHVISRKHRHARVPLEEKWAIAARFNRGAMQTEERPVAIV